jgi:type IV pilus assembly protein PilY1
VADDVSTLVNAFGHWAGASQSQLDISLIGCGDPFFTWETIDWNIHDPNKDGTLELQSDNNALKPSARPGKRGVMRTDNILVEEGTGYLTCLSALETDCFPGGQAGAVFDPIKQEYTFEKLRSYIAGTGCSGGTLTGIDGWYHDFSDPRERNLGSAALLGGLLTFTSYQPFNDKCKAEGQSFLYGLHYQTGTAPVDSVFGTYTDNTKTYIKEKMSLGRGLSTSPSIHIGSSEDYAAKAFIQTSTGEIIEITQERLPVDNTHSGRQGWSDRCE